MPLINKDSRCYEILFHVLKKSFIKTQRNTLFSLKQNLGMKIKNEKKKPYAIKKEFD